MIKKIFFIFFLIFNLFINQSYAKDDIMILQLKDGDVLIELFDDVEPNHVARFKKLSSEKKLKIVPGATHLFEEPGTLEEVARLATEWFIKYLNTYKK